MMEKIHLATLEDIPRIASCHRQAFPKSLSSLQGSRFVEKMLEWYIQDERGVLYYSEDDGKVSGYVGAIITLKPGLHGAASSISQFAFSEFVLSFIRKPWLLFHVQFFKKYQLVAKNILYKTGLLRKKAPGNSTAFKPYFGLIVIGVHPDFRGKGVGTLLMDSFEEEAKVRGLNYLILSVKANNIKALSLYEKSGWLKKEQIGDSFVMHKEI